MAGNVTKLFSNVTIFQLVFVWNGNKKNVWEKIAFSICWLGRVTGRRKENVFILGHVINIIPVIGPLKYCQNRVFKNNDNAILVEKVEES